MRFYHQLSINSSSCCAPRKNAGAKSLPLCFRGCMAEAELLLTKTQLHCLIIVSDCQSSYVHTHTQKHTCYISTVRACKKKKDLLCACCCTEAATSTKLGGRCCTTAERREKRRRQINRFLRALCALATRNATPWRLVSTGPVCLGDTERDPLKIDSLARL